MPAQNSVIPSEIIADFFFSCWTKVIAIAIVKLLISKTAVFAAPYVSSRNCSPQIKRSQEKAKCPVSQLHVAATDHGSDVEHVILDYETCSLKFQKVLLPIDHWHKKGGSIPTIASFSPPLKRCERSIISCNFGVLTSK